MGSGESSASSQPAVQAKKKPGKPKNKRKRKQRKGVKKMKNSETKNIPKNYGKQIIKFALHNPSLLQSQCLSGDKGMEHLMGYLREKKRSMNKISDLRELWEDGQYGRVLRVVSMHFLRTRCHAWIYNSRVEDRWNPLKYRPRIIQGVQQPAHFIYLKEY